MKPAEQRLKVLDEHIRHADNYLKYRDIFKQYKQMKPKKQEDFYEAHRAQLIPYEAAERYLKGVMNGKTGLPIKAWKMERDKLNADRKRLNGEYVSLKNEIVEVEKIRKNVYEIMREETRREQPTRK